MIRILTDCPERLEDFVPAATDWRPTEADRLSPVEHALWAALATRDQVWWATGEPSRTSFWHRVIIIDHAPQSQFDVLHQRLGAGLTLDGPTAALALNGRNFKGQRGRPWAVVPGNLFLTVSLPLHGFRAVDMVAPLIMLPSVAVVDAIHDTQEVTAPPDIKWVNDVRIDRQKVAGVLAASQCLGEDIRTATWGIGVNVALAPEVVATPFVPRVGSLSTPTRPVSLAAFFWRILGALEQRYRSLRQRGPKPLWKDYCAASGVLGRQVRIWAESDDFSGPPERWPAPRARGRVLAIGPDLALTLTHAEAPVTRGRLALERDCENF